MVNGGLNLVTTLAGSPDEDGGFRDSPMPTHNFPSQPTSKRPKHTPDPALFNKPTSVAVDYHGNYIVTEAWNNRVRKITSDGFVTTLAGNGELGYADGPGREAQFQLTTVLREINGGSVGVDKDGNIILADTFNNCIREITPDGCVTTLAGDGIAQSKDGYHDTASFDQPVNLTVAIDGTIYVVDQGDMINTILRGEETRVCIRKITPDGIVTTLSGEKRLMEPNTIAASGTEAEILFVNGRPKNDTLQRIHVNGSAYELCYTPRIEHTRIAGIAIDGDDNFICADTVLNRILKITPEGEMSILAGDGCEGHEDGPGSSARFSEPCALAVDARGNVVVCDRGNNCIRIVDAQLTPPRHFQVHRYGKSMGKLPEYMAGVLANQNFTDVTIRVGDRKFPAHVLTLSRSPFFHTMFSSNAFLENSKNTDHVVELKDVSPDVFEVLLKYLYTDRVDEVAENFDTLDLHAAARFFMLPDLLVHFEREILRRLRVENVLKCLVYAKIHSLEDLAQMCMKMITGSVSVFGRVVLTDEYIRYSREYPSLNQELLEACGGNVHDESEEGCVPIR